MRDDPIATLERELVDAARRRMPVTDELEASQEPRGPWPSAVRPARRRSSLGAFAAVVLSAVAVVVALGAILSVRGHRPSGASSSHQAAVAPIPGRQQLIDILGVLRRPQVPSDLDPHYLPFLSGRGGVIQALTGTPDRALIRYATTTPWGAKIYLVPLKPATVAELKAALRRFHGSRGLISQIRSRGETVGIYGSDGGGGGSDVASIEAGQGMEIDGAGRTFAGGSTETRYILVVPDGVIRVGFYFPAQAVPAGGPVYRHSLTVTVPVHGNVAAVQVGRQCCGGPPALIWYGAGGRVIKEIGSMKPPPASPQPAPETALSRAAEHDPSTPNRVWVTPGVGGPDTNFKLHFEVLLNDADYSYQLSGTPCPAITVNGGSGGGTDDVRGQIWSDFVTATPGQRWCPGTYHLSATVMDLGRSGSLKHPAKPFGTATFTVKP
jgi:hypothetical protein